VKAGHTTPLAQWLLRARPREPKGGFVYEHATRRTGTNEESSSDRRNQSGSAKSRQEGPGATGRNETLHPAGLDPPVRKRFVSFGSRTQAEATLLTTVGLAGRESFARLSEHRADLRFRRSLPVELNANPASDQFALLTMALSLNGIRQVPEMRRRRNRRSPPRTCQRGHVSWSFNPRTTGARRS
jgi:hypothetical protein